MYNCQTWLEQRWKMLGEFKRNIESTPVYAKQLFKLKNITVAALEFIDSTTTGSQLQEQEEQQET